MRIYMKDDNAIVDKIVECQSEIHQQYQACSPSFNSKLESHVRINGCINRGGNTNGMRDFCCVFTRTPNVKSPPANLTCAEILDAEGLQNSCVLVPM